MTDDGDNPVGAELSRGDPSDRKPGDEAGKAKGKRKAEDGKSAAADIGGLVLERHRLKTARSGTTYWWNSAYWEEVEKQVLLHWVFTEGTGRSGHSFRSEVVEWLKAATTDPLLAWSRVGLGEAALSNGVLDVETGKLRPHAPEDMLERVVPWPWDAAAECPVWTTALDDWFGDSESGVEQIQALQEFFGYILLPHARFKKALILYGDSNTGKSVVAFVAQTLVGTGFCCQLPVDQMDDPVMRAVLKGKALNVMTELSADSMIRDGGFKTLVGTEEPVLINEKYKPAEMYLPAAKHLIATNNLPRIDDRTDAVFNRLLIVAMDKAVPPEAQDRELGDKLKAEMPGILRWAVEGARRLVERGGRWPTPQRSRDLIDQYRDQQNPVGQFVKEVLEPAPIGEELNCRITVSDLTDLYNLWNKGGRKQSQQWLGRRLRELEKASWFVGHVKDARWSGATRKTLFGYRDPQLPSAGETFEGGA